MFLSIFWKNKISVSFFICFLFLLFVLTPNNSLALKRRHRAVVNIEILKKGALLVRLKTAVLKINGLKNLGRNKEAEEMRLMQEHENAAIVDAFRKNFNFCLVFFFYSNNSEEIKTGNYKGLLFDINFKVDTSFNSSNYLIGELDKSESLTIQSFLIKDKNYKQLGKPFPFLTRRYNSLVITRTEDQIVSLLNKRLHNFYETR